MKAKRLLSAFLAVAMMLTTLVALGTVSYAGEEDPAVELTITEMTAEEIETEALSVPEGDTAYWITAYLKNYGTLESAARTGYGRKLGLFEMYLEFDGLVTDYLDYSETLKEEAFFYLDFYGVGCNSGINYLQGYDGKYFVVSFAAADAKTAYPPVSNSKTTVSDDILVVQMPILAKKDFTVDVAKVNVEITTYTATTATVEDLSTTQEGGVSVVPSITVGEAESGATVEVGGTTAENNGGVAFEDASDVYDNAFAVSATINAATATEIGVLFIPDWALETGEELTVANGAKAAYTDSAAISNGSITIRAAIKNIPRKYEGTTINLLSRAYALVDGEYTYAENTTTTPVLFGAAE